MMPAIGGLLNCCWVIHPESGLSSAGCCIAEGRSRALLSGGEDGVQLRRSHTQQRAYCGRREPEPYGNGLVVVAFILQAQRGRMSFGKPIDGGAAVHTGKL